MPATAKLLTIASAEDEERLMLATLATYFRVLRLSAPAREPALPSYAF